MSVLESTNLCGNFRGHKNPMLSNLKFTSGVYKLTIGTKLYIGFSKNMRSRCQNHLCSLSHQTHDNWKLQKAWNEHKSANFEIVELTDDSNRELYWIDFYKSNDDKFGYNISYGLKLSEDTKKKLRSFTHSEETKQKISKAQIGRTHSPETKEKIRQSNLGKKRSEETKLKIKQNHRCNKIKQELE